MFEITVRQFMDLVAAGAILSSLHPLPRMLQHRTSRCQIGADRAPPAIERHHHASLLRNPAMAVDSAISPGATEPRRHEATRYWRAAVTAGNPAGRTDNGWSNGGGEA